MLLKTKDTDNKCVDEMYGYGPSWEQVVSRNIWYQETQHFINCFKLANPMWIINLNNFRNGQEKSYGMRAEVWWVGHFECVGYLGGVHLQSMWEPWCVTEYVRNLGGSLSIWDT